MRRGANSQEQVILRMLPPILFLFNITFICLKLHLSMAVAFHAFSGENCTDFIFPNNDVISRAVVTTNLNMFSLQLFNHRKILKCTLEIWFVIIVIGGCACVCVCVCGGGGGGGRKRGFKDYGEEDFTHVTPFVIGKKHFSTDLDLDRKRAHAF